MRCPSDNTELVVTEHEGVSIHSCPSCSGIWMKRGELDEIIDRSISQAALARAGRPEGNDRIEWHDPWQDHGPIRAPEKPRRRRDKYTEDERPPRKEKKKRANREISEEMLDF